MMGMEMMLSKMIGMTPEQMREASNQVVGGAADAFTRIKNIQEQLGAISERLERIEANERRAEPGSGNARGNGGGGGGGRSKSGKPSGGGD